jgi:predicted CopG family antitoxin
MGNPRFTSIYVRMSTYEKLKELKSRMGVRSYSDVIEMALESVHKLEQLRVASILCVSKATARASPLGWVKLFQQLGVQVDVGFSFLRSEGPDMVVDQEKCKQFFDSVLGGGPK